MTVQHQIVMEGYQNEFNTKKKFQQEQSDLILTVVRWRYILADTWMEVAVSSPNLDDSQCSSWNSWCIYGWI